VKALYCNYCNAVVGLPHDTSIVGCRCIGGMNHHGPRCRGRWVDPVRGLAIFTEIAQGGAERDDLHPHISKPCRCGSPGRKEGGLRLCDDCSSGWTDPSPLYHERGTAVRKPRALFVLGIHNTVLTMSETSRLDHVAHARAARGSLFAERESLIVRFRPGDSCDTGYVPPALFEAGEFRNSQWLDEDEAVYTAESRRALARGLR
jgi:hypothetical protein